MPAPTRRNVRLAIACTADGRPKYLISALAGFTPNLLSGFISGKQEPSPEQIVNLARVLDVTPESITPDYADLDGAA